jgi:hypothetical protein
MDPATGPVLFKILKFEINDDIQSRLCSLAWTICSRRAWSMDPATRPVLFKILKF